MSGGVASASKPPLANTRARDYAISDAQDPEQRSTSELPARKVQKINKELTKQNNQLAKDLDALKKDKETLLLEKQKLKNENKTLERELRKVSSKGDIQRLLKNGPAENDPEVVAEQRSQERDRKIEGLKKRIRATLEYIQPTSEDELLEDEVSPESKKRKMKQTNDGGWDSESSSALQKENIELRSKVASLETELEQLVKSSSPKTSRIKPGNFFRRSKRSGGDIKLAQVSTDRPRSPEIPLSELITFDTPSSSVEGTPIHKSLPAHISPNQSPKFDARDRRNSEIHTLQSRLRISNEEKKSFEERSKALEAELRDIKRQLEQLQEKADEGNKASDEAERVKKSLKLANSEKSSLSGQIEHLRKEVDDLKAGKRSVERNMVDSLKKKDNRIEELESDCKKAKTECEKLRKELDSTKGSVAEVKRRDNKIEDLELDWSKTKVKCEKLQKELDSARASLVEMKKKDNKISELEMECTRAKKECEQLQKELDSTKKSAAVETKSETKATTSTSFHTHTATAAKPPSGAKITSPSHSASSKYSKPASSTVKTPPSPTVAATTTTADDNVFDSVAQSSNKTATSATVTESTLSKLSRKSSGDTVDKKASGSQPRGKDPANPPMLRRRRSSTELIELFENAKEVQKVAETNIKKNTSYANLATSNTHRTKVAARRAMFENKNGEETTSSTTNGRSETSSGSSSAANRSAYRRSWTSDLVQSRRKSYTDPNSTSALPEGKEEVVSHSKSQSLDATQQFKPESQGQVPPSPTTSKATTTINSSPKRTAVSVAPTKPGSLNLSSMRVSTSQQSASSTPNSSSSVGTPNSASTALTPSSAGSAKVSKITFKSSSTTPGSSSSPALNTHKEVTVGSSMRANIPTSPARTPSSTNMSINGRTSRITSSSSSTATTPSRSPTTPLRSPTTPLKSPYNTTTGRESSMAAGTSSVVVTTSSGVSKTPSYVPSYLRSNTVTGAETSANKPRVANEAKAPVTRSQTAVTFTVTSAGPRHHPIKTGFNQQATPEQKTSILKRSSTLLNSPNDLKKASSLLDIPENAEETPGSGNSESTVVANSNPPTATPTTKPVTTAKVMHRSPEPTRFQRRKREERPKTMYAGANRSETVSLVRLISKYQEQERKDKGGTDNAAISAPASSQVPAVNGNASPTPAAATTFPSSAVTTAGSSSSSTNVMTSQSPRRRPQSYYGGSSDL